VKYKDRQVGNFIQFTVQLAKYLNRVVKHKTKAFIIIYLWNI